MRTSDLTLFSSVPWVDCLRTQAYNQYHAEVRKWRACAFSAKPSVFPNTRPLFSSPGSHTPWFRKSRPPPQTAIEGILSSFDVSCVNRHCKTGKGYDVNPALSGSSRAACGHCIQSSRKTASYSTNTTTKGKNRSRNCKSLIPWGTYDYDVFFERNWEKWNDKLRIKGVLCSIKILCCILIRCVRKIVKTIISFVNSVRLSVHMEQLGSHWTNFHKILCLKIFLSRICQVGSIFINIWHE